MNALPNGPERVFPFFSFPPLIALRSNEIVSVLRVLAKIDIVVFS